MYTVAILRHPGHNRVYFDEAKKLSMAELSCALPRLSTPGARMDEMDIAGVHYLTLTAEKPLTTADLYLLSRLSFAYALFELQGSSESPLLAPIVKPYTPAIDEGVSSILKYAGKTNELFTRMMINVAAFASDFDPAEQLRLIDPVAGKGTTMYEALLCGYDAAGIEIGDVVAHEAYIYFKRFLETGKYKHEFRVEKVSGPNKQFTATRYACTFAPTRESLKEGGQSFTLVAGNAVNASTFFPKTRFHLLVGDLPYGVQHSNVTNQKQTSITRSPGELLKACLPAWRELLLPGGCLALSWNTFVLPREAICNLLAANGLQALEDGAYASFVHRVDQAIRRDFVVAKRV